MHLQTEIEKLNLRIERIVSDAESEKETRKRIHSRFEERIVDLERAMWKGIGALAALQVVGSVVLALYLNK